MYLTPQTTMVVGDTQDHISDLFTESDSAGRDSDDEEGIAAMETEVVPQAEKVAALKRLLRCTLCGGISHWCRQTNSLRPKEGPDRENQAGKSQVQAQRCIGL